MKKLLTFALIALITVSASAQRNSRRDRQNSVNMTELLNTQADEEFRDGKSSNFAAC